MSDIGQAASLLGAGLMSETEFTEWAARISAEIVQSEAIDLTRTAIDRDPARIQADNIPLAMTIREALMAAYRAGFEDGSKIRKHVCHI